MVEGADLEANRTWIALHSFKEEGDGDNEKYIKIAPGDIIVSIKENKVIWSC